MSNSISKSNFVRQFPNGINLRDPEVQRGLSSPALQGAKAELEALADNNGHISTEKLDQVFSVIDHFDKDGSRSSIRDQGLAGQLANALRGGAQRPLGGRPGGNNTISSASARPRANVQGPNAPAAFTGPVNEPISTERHQQLLKAQGEYIGDKIKGAKAGPLKDFGDLLGAQAYIKANPEDFTEAQKRSIDQRLAALQSNPSFQREMQGLKSQFLRDNPEARREVEGLKRFLASPQLDQLQTQAEAAAGPNDRPNVYLEQLGLLGSLDTEAASAMKDGIAERAVENLKRKHPERYVKLKQTMMTQALLQNIDQLPPEEQAQVRELVQDIDTAFEEVLSTTNLVGTNLDRSGTEVLKKVLTKVAGKASRIGNQGNNAVLKRGSELYGKLEDLIENSPANTFDSKLESMVNGFSETLSPRGTAFLKNNVHRLGSPGFKAGMMLMSGAAFAKSDGVFEQGLNLLSAADHGANLFAALTEGAEAGTKMASFGSKAASAAKVLGPLVSVLTTGYDAYNAYGDFSSGDLGGGIGKTLQAAGGVALLAPGVGWVTGAALLGGGMAVDWMFGENGSETAARQLSERRLESFSGDSAPRSSYSSGDRARFQEARGLLQEARQKMGRLPNMLNVVQATNEMKSILTQGYGVGSDDDFAEMTAYYDQHGRLPPFSSDALETIERSLYLLQYLNEKMDNHIR